MKYKIVVHQTATVDLREIIGYYVNELDSLYAAGKVYSYITEKIQSLKIFPHRGMIYSQSERIIRGIQTHGYVIYFYVNDKQSVVHIIRIAHSHRLTDFH